MRDPPQAALDGFRVTPLPAEPVVAVADRDGFYVPWLDGVRALAALAVLFSHSMPMPGFIGSTLQPFLGSFGVYVFFVLSAFLLSRLLLLEQQRYGAIRLVPFWIRRSLRIWPLYVTFGAFAIVYAAMTDVGPAAKILGLAAAHFTFVEDVTMGHWGWSAALPFSEHLWTISLEEQAYFLLPIALSVYFAAPSRRALKVGLITIAVAAATARLSLVLLGGNHVLIWASPLHPDAFLAGVYLGIGTSVASGFSQAQPGRGTLWLLAAGAVLAVLMLTGPPLFFAPAEIYGYPAFAFAATALIIAVANLPVLARLLAARPLRYLGKISYGIYVFHLLALEMSASLLSRFGALTPLNQLALCSLMAIVAADLSYRILERPFLALKDRFARVRSRPI